jgi:hypothetical protein
MRINFATPIEGQLPPDYPNRGSIIFMSLMITPIEGQPSHFERPDYPLCVLLYISTIHRGSFYALLLALKAPKYPLKIARGPKVAQRKDV